jgi:transcriptional regulator with XRE-family HTH domain
MTLRTERIAKTVAVERARHGWTQHHVADQIGMGYAVLYRRLRGLTDWRYHELEALAGLFDMSIDELTQDPPTTQHRPVA